MSVGVVCLLYVWAVVYVMLFGVGLVDFTLGLFVTASIRLVCLFVGVFGLVVFLIMLGLVFTAKLMFGLLVWLFDLLWLFGLLSVYFCWFGYGVTDVCCLIVLVGCYRFVFICGCFDLILDYVFYGVM